MVLSGLNSRFEATPLGVVHFAKFLNRKEFFILYFSTTYAQAARVLEYAPNPLLGTTLYLRDVATNVLP